MSLVRAVAVSRGIGSSVLFELASRGRKLFFFDGAGLALLADKEQAIAIEIGLDNLLAGLGLLRLVSSANSGEMILGDGAGPNSAIPGDGPLANVVLKRGQVGGRVEGHGGGGRGSRVRPWFTV
ncbi:hypothetical protein HYQ46_009902 [Verticillium longisporum]|nr:hypothetical protein HYQ46_009902 [Verticillium longisporum]